MHCSPYLDIAVVAGLETNDVGVLIAYLLRGVYRSLGCGAPLNPFGFRLGSRGYLQIDGPRPSSFCNHGGNNGYRFRPRDAKSRRPNIYQKKFYHCEVRTIALPIDRFPPGASIRPAEYE